MLLFVPGNPGCIGWYIDFLSILIRHLGVGYAARGISYAGHGVGEDDSMRMATTHHTNGADPNIAWTVDGQVQHKVDWVDQVRAELQQWRHQATNSNRESLDANNTPTEDPKSRSPLSLLQQDGVVLPRFIILSHSIGSHLVQRGLVLRPDILKQTELVLHLMPFVRFDPYALIPKVCLSTVARSPDVAISLLQMMSRVTKSLPRTWIDFYMERVAGVEDPKGRQLAIDIVQQPTFAKNFLMLGTEEVRDIPEVHDEAALRIIGQECSTAMLFCGGPDMWAPEFHMKDLKELKRRGTIPSNIHLEYKEELLHGFVVFPTMVEPVVSFCLRAIINHTIPPPASRL